ncbi:hypothetical protein ACFIOY_20630 [Bradyrhizobium sp. TZ2]
MSGACKSLTEQTRDALEELGGDIEMYLESLEENEGWASQVTNRFHVHTSTENPARLALRGSGCACRHRPKSVDKQSAKWIQKR